MKKLFKLSFIVLSFLGLGVSQSGAVDISAGISANAGLFDAQGTERIRSTGTQTTVETTAASAEALFMYPSVYVEASFGVLSIGVDYIPVGVETEATSRTDYNLSTVTNTAKAEIKDHITAYAILKSAVGVYAKFGISNMTVVSLENLGTGSVYGNTQTVGGHIGVGYQHDLPDMFVRAELGYSVYEEIKLDNSVSANTNIINVDLEGHTAKISIGKTF